MYKKNEIVIFKDAYNDLTGYIEGQEGEHYHIKGLDGRNYFKIETEILKSIGTRSYNEARNKAEEWEKGKCKYPD